MEIDYKVNLLDDMIEQFKGKANIEVLLEVINQQLQEVFDFYVQLYTGRSIDTAVGSQLDGIGDIVGLTRQEVVILIGKEAPDNVYRKYLHNKIIQNTFNCTYEDLMKSISMLWDKDGPAYWYSEDPELPATIILNFDNLGHHAKELTEIPLAKPGGVGLKVNSTTVMDLPIYYGFAVRMKSNQHISGAEAVLDPAFWLLDELEDALIDERGYRLKA